MTEREIFRALMALPSEERIGLVLAVLEHDLGALMCAGRGLDDETRGRFLGCFLPAQAQEALAAWDRARLERVN